MSDIDYSKSKSSYVLITAAYNEETQIGATIESVLAQSVLPCKWVIVSDGSTDSTDIIIRRYSERISFIDYIRREKTGMSTGFESKVSAMHEGIKSMSGLVYQFIGVLDADITFGSDYYERVIRKFENDEDLGIAGGFVYERRKDIFKCRPSNSRTSVAGAIQFFRKECYEAVGGHMALPLGGEDWVCEILARMNGWAVKAFPEIVVYHHKPSEVKRGALRDAIRLGRMDFAVGSHPLFEVVKCLRRVREKPFFFRALFRLLGFTYSLVKRENIAVTGEVANYLKQEQLKRLKMHIQMPR